ncbi:hypothetical protein BKA70DRAFT_1447534 [Coprinopsis sp. MPI-PUGE-AT-0042]|nr:hypothetical protein BKA70DRAFT_1447534 [Coprinopsis sp. MPI-PUGE-AT-0042]
MTLEELHGLSMYLSSRIRAAGNQYCMDVLSMKEETHVKFIRHFYGEVTMFTMTEPVIRLCYPPLVLPDPYLPDRILRHYHYCWWDPFDITKNWDGRVDTIVKVYRVQSRLMAPTPIPPLATAHLSDLATEELANCLRSMKVTRAMLDLDTTETLKEVGRTMLLINRLQDLGAQVKAEEVAQAQALMTDRLAVAAGIAPEAAAELLKQSKNAPTILSPMLDFTVLSDADWVSFLDFLSLRVQLALKGTQRLEWANVHMQVAAEVDNACFCVAIAHFHSSTLCYNDAFIEDSVPDQSGDSLDNETGSVATPNHCDPTSASGIVPPTVSILGIGGGCRPT